MLLVGTCTRSARSLPLHLDIHAAHGGPLNELEARAGGSSSPLLVSSYLLSNRTDIRTTDLGRRGHQAKPRSLCAVRNDPHALVLLGV